MGVLTAVIIVSVTGLLGAAILVVASQFMKVEVDERVEQIHEALPNANCWPATAAATCWRRCPRC